MNDESGPEAAPEPTDGEKVGSTSVLDTVRGRWQVNGLKFGPAEVTGYFRGTCPVHRNTWVMIEIDELSDDPAVIHPCRRGCLPGEIARQLEIPEDAAVPEPGFQAMANRAEREKYGTDDAADRYVRVVAALFGGGYAGKRADHNGSGEGRYACPCCGAAGDGHGLKVSRGDSQPVVLTCFSCRAEYPEILEALGLTPDDVSRPVPELYLAGVPRSSPYVSGTGNTSGNGVPGTFPGNEEQQRSAFRTPSKELGNGTLPGTDSGVNPGAESVPGDSGTGNASGNAPDLFFDMAAFLAGGVPDPPKPQFAVRTDGHALFYAGQVNVVFGDPESAKTWLCLAAASDALKAGKRAAVIDMDHNGPEATADHLQMLGAPLEALADPGRFRYVEPEDAPHLLAVVAALIDWAADIVIVDSIGELLPLLGLSSNSPDDYTIASNRALKPMAKAGAAVVCIDHLAKNTESRGYGATGTTAKRRAAGGVSLRVTLKDTFVPGRGGKSALTIHKDRHGGLRRNCPTPDKGEPLAGIFIMECELTGSTTWRIAAPQAGDRAPTVADADADELAALTPPPTSVRDVKDRLGWGGSRATAALQAWRAREPDSGCEDCDRLALINPEMQCWQHR